MEKKIVIMYKIPDFINETCSIKGNKILPNSYVLKSEHKPHNLSMSTFFPSSSFDREGL